MATELDREAKVRKEVLRVFNLRRDNFSLLREYNDYLEKVEDIIFDLAYSNDNEVKLQRQKEMDDFKHNNKTLIAKNRAIAENEYKQQILEKERREVAEEERKQKEIQHKHLKEITIQEKQEEKNASSNFQVPMAMQMGLNQKRQPAPKMIAQTGVIYATLPPEEQRKYESAAGYTTSFVMQRANQEAYTLVL